MTTVLIHGRPTHAVRLTCDPFPWKTATGPTVLRVRWKKADAKPFYGSLAPVVFELGGSFYEGNFRHVTRIDEPPDEIECTLISEGPIREAIESEWSFKRLSKRRFVKKGVHDGNE